MSLFSVDRLGFSSACYAGLTLDQAAQRGQRLGFRTFEMLAFDGYRHSQGVLRGFYFEHTTAAERDELRAIADRFDHVSTHAPFIDMTPLAPNPSVRETAVRQLEIAIEAVAFLGGSTTTTHVAPRSTWTYEDSAGDLISLYRHLGDRAGERGVTVTIETGWPGDVRAFADLIHGIDHPAVGANVDVGHLVGTIPSDLRGTEEGRALYNDRLEEHVRSLEGRLFHFHLHDVRREDFRDHRAAGRGFLDYSRLMATAAEIGYEGLFVFELEEPDFDEALRDSKVCIERAMGLAN
ncbi:MAG: sugar phosphate isomerase/epimerase [Armatimonadetes bacterium]|nr:sugar phosphate isomerase/epimerase [Armatimonadota bacterium]